MRQKRNIPPWLRRLRTLCLCAVFLTAVLAGGYYIYVRVFRNNFHVVVEGKVYRSAQPSPTQLRRWRDRYGLKSVLNLRGSSSNDYYVTEEAAAEELGLELVSIRFSAQDLPPRPYLLELFDALESLPQPMLLHCAEGADRTGMASVLAAMAIGQQGYEQASGQLSAKYFHLSPDPQHIAGLFEAYEEWCAREGKNTAGWEQFRTWAMDHYHVKYYFIRYQVPERMDARPGQTIPVTVGVRNASDSVLPGSDKKKHFTLSAFLGSSLEQRPEAELAARVELPARDLPPGQSLQLTLQLHAPVEPGTYRVRYDLIEEGVTWFARQGSPVGQTLLTVSSLDSETVSAGSAQSDSAR